MKKTIFTLLMLCVLFGAFAQSTIYTTTFPSGGAPSGWSTQILGFEGETNWYFGDTYLPPIGNFSTPAAIFNDDISFDETSVARLKSPVFDVSGYETVNLSFDYGLSQTNDGLGTLSIEVYNGTSWHQIMFVNTNTPPVSTGSLDMTAYKNENFQVRYTYNDQYANSWGAGVANFSLSGTYDVIPNNDIAGAFELTCGQTMLGTTITSTAKTGLPVCNGVDGNTHGVWYKFTDEMTQSAVTLSLCGSAPGFDTRLSVFKGSPDALVCVTANDDSCGTLSSATFNYDGYSDYYVLVSGAGETTGDFTINATCVPIAPPNDEIANAFDVDTFTQPYTDHAVQFIYATAESQAFDYEVNGCDGGQLPYVWYKFTATANGTARVILPTPSPGGLNLIHFYSAPTEAATVSQLSWVNQTSNACNAFDDDRQINITEGTTYYVAITLEGGNSDVDVIITYDCEAPAQPAATAQQFCGSATVASLQATHIEGAVVKWYDTEGGTALTSSTALASGTYYVTQTVNACESEPLAVIVTVTPAPALPGGSETQNFTAGQTIADLDVTATEGNTLSWYILNDAGDYVSIPATTVLEDGAVYYATQQINNCQSAYLTVTVHIAAGTDGFDFSRLSVYPNPAKDVITVTGTTLITKISIYNILGQKVVTQNAAGQTVQVQLSTLQPGTYILTVEASVATKSFKLIKM